MSLPHCTLTLPFSCFQLPSIRSQFMFDSPCKRPGGVRSCEPAALAESAGACLRHPRALSRPSRPVDPPATEQDDEKDDDEDGVDRHGQPRRRRNRLLLKGAGIVAVSHGVHASCPSIAGAWC